MTTWRVMPELRRVTWCQVALELRDEFTGTMALGGITLALDMQSDSGWQETDIQPSRNLGGVFLYTGLGRSLDPVSLPTFRVRVRIEANYYRPMYRTSDDAIEIDVPTYNDSAPPIATPLVPELVQMLPSVGYPYGGHVRTIRGRVLDHGGEPLADAIVEADGVERAITSENGAFILPLRWQVATANVDVVVDHPRSGQGAIQVLTLPGDLVGNHDITVN